LQSCAGFSIYYNSTTHPFTSGLSYSVSNHAARTLRDATFTKTFIEEVKNTTTKTGMLQKQIKYRLKYTTQQSL
jgi:hypothetical protein